MVHRNSITAVHPTDFSSLFHVSAILPREQISSVRSRPRPYVCTPAALAVTCASPSRECLTRGSLRVPHRRKEELSPFHPVSIIARPGGLVDQDPTRVPRVRPGAVDPCAGGDGLQRRAGRALEVAAVVWVRDRTSQEGGDVDDHPVHSDVAVGCHQGRSLRAVKRLVERPCALPRALCLGVAHPHVGRFPPSSSVTAAAHAETLDGDICRCQNDGDRVDGVELAGQGEEVVPLKGLPEGVGLVKDLPADDEVG